MSIHYSLVLIRISHTYPRDFDRDKKLANEAGADYCFHPTVSEMYLDDMTVQLTVKKRTKMYCVVEIGKVILMVWQLSY